MVYHIELVSSYPGWWRYNLYISLVAYNEAGQRIDFATFTDHVYDVVGHGHAAPPVGWKQDRGAVLETVPCAYAEAYINVVTNTMPASNRVGDSPEFEAVLIARGDGKELFRKTLMINNWGGFSVAGLQIKG